MKKDEKMTYLKEEHWSKWITTRDQVEDRLSDRQPLWCICGTLATGYHEMGCRRFQAKVDSETIKELKDLLPKKNKKGDVNKKSRENSIS